MSASIELADSEATEACVCTSRPACCQNVWAQECVDLAMACGDPSCDGSGTDDGTTGGDDTGDTGVELACDPDFEFSPQDPAPGAPFTATFSDPVGLTWVGMHAEAPGGAMVEGGNLQITGSGPFHWSYDFAGLAAGDRDVLLGDLVDQRLELGHDRLGAVGRADDGHHLRGVVDVGVERQERQDGAQRLGGAGARQAH